MNLFAFDIGGTNIKYGVVTETNDILCSGSIPTPYTSPEDLTETLADLVIHCPEPVQGIAISLPGSAQGEDGIILRSGALQYLQGFSFGKALQDKSGLPVTLENDGRCAALGEHTAGALQKAFCGVVLVVGTSLGGGIILDGKLLRGNQDFAGRFSHILSGFSTDSNERLGFQIGKEGLRRAVVAACGLPPETPMSGFEIFDRVNSGDPDARKGLDCFCQPLALLIANLQVILDPEIIAIGGGISSQPALLDAINRQMSILYSDKRHPRPVSHIVLSALGNQANLIGAAEVWRQNRII